LTDEEAQFVDELVAVQEALLADSRSRATAARGVAQIGAKVGALNAPTGGADQSKGQPGGIDKARDPQRDSPRRDPSLETRDDSIETADDRE
jgi:hypothetical protein